MATFARLHFKTILALAVLVGYAIFTFSNLTTYPRIWLDEGFKMQLARNFAETGKMAIQFEPSKIEYSVHNASTGWPVIAGLGLFLKIFGVSFATARTFSVIVLLAFLLVTWLMVRKKWGDLPALLSLALLVTYAPLFANGKMILAEIPGLLFLALGFFFLRSEIGPPKGGATSFVPYIFFGLFAASKLSFVAVFIPTLLVGLIWAVWKRQVELKQAIYSFAITCLIALPTLYMSLSAKIGLQLANPYGQVSHLQTIISNLKLFLSSSTLWHFLLLVLVASWWVLVQWRKGERHWLIVTLKVFCLLVVAYWLVSPGVFRYLLPTTLLLLALLPIFLPRKWLFLAMLLVLVQGYHFTTSASISHGGDYLIFESYMKENPISESASVGIINSAFAPVFVPREHMTQFFRIDAIEEGVNVLSVQDQNNLPDYLIYEVDNLANDIAPYMPIIFERYQKVVDFDRIVIWRKK